MKNWWKESVVYQIYPRSFMDSNGDGVGDILGIINRLDYLKELGVSVLWISPIYASPGVDNGYDISDYKKILPDFGTMADFDLLLEKAHQKGIKIVMDLVANHTSDQHAWFAESRSSREHAKRNWYIWRDPFNGKEPNGMQSFFSGPAWEVDQTTGQYYMHLFAKEQPDLNWENPDVRQAVYDIIRWWLDKGIDGFRMDVINLISKPSEATQNGSSSIPCVNGPHVHAYLKEMNREVLSQYDIMTVGETMDVTPQDARQYAGFDTNELNMVFQFELMEFNQGDYGKWHTNPYPLTDFKRIITKWQKGLEGAAWNSLYLENHDRTRSVSRFGNADTTLNWEKSAKMLATCLHLLQGTPYIYQGQELGMTNYPFAALTECRDLETLNAYRELVEEKKVYTPEKMMDCIRNSTRDHSRTPMQWSGDENAGFTTGTPWIAVNPNYTQINAQAQLADENSIFHYYRKLILLRNEYPIIVYGTYELLNDERIFAYKRTYHNQELVVLCNFSKQSLQILPDMVKAKAELLIGNYKMDTQYEQMLRPYEARVYLNTIN